MRTKTSHGEEKPASTFNIVLAFAIVYIVWGSTYFFIQKAIQSFPPFMLGALRFFAAAFIMLIWCIYKKEKVFVARQIIHAIVGGLLLLFIGNGAVIWVEQYMPSAIVAITVSSSPLWFVLLDKPKWNQNLRSRSTVLALVMGFFGVVLLFYKSIVASVYGGSTFEAGGMLLVTLAAILPISTKKLISTANVSTFLSPFARPIFKLAHHSPGAILVGM